MPRIIDKSDRFRARRIPRRRLMAVIRGSGVAEGLNIIYFPVAMMAPPPAPPPSPQTVPADLQPQMLSPQDPALSLAECNTLLSELSLSDEARLKHTCETTIDGYHEKGATVPGASLPAFDNSKSSVGVGASTDIVMDDATDVHYDYKDDLGFQEDHAESLSEKKSDGPDVSKLEAVKTGHAELRKLDEHQIAADRAT